VAITGVLYLFLLAERSMLNFIIGFVNVVLYIIVCYIERIYGDAIFYLIFDVPVAIVAFFVWRRAIRRNGVQATLTAKVDSRQIKKRFYLPIVLVLCAFTVAFGLFLRLIGGINVWIDAASTGASITATLFMLFRFKEQWVMWIVVYALSIALWAVTDNMLMVMMSIGCLISSLLGWFDWYRNARKNTRTTLLGI